MFRKMICVTIIVGLLTASFNVEVKPVKANQQDGLFTSEIGIWYTVWWTDQAPYDTLWDEWTRYQPVLGDYSAGDEEIIREHMEWMKEAGIDFVILDDTNGHGNNEGTIAANIDKIFKVVEDMPEGSAPQLALAIGAGQWVANDPEVHQAEADLVYESYAQSPVYYHWKGKPLLVNYTTPDWFDQWDDERFSVRRATGKVSEGAHAAPDSGLWGWVFDQRLTPTEVEGVMPGWDTTHLDRDTEPIPREEGELYANMWLEAIKDNPEAIVISSFNDFAEETAIEAATPRDEEVEPYKDYYGNPTPDWYEQLTEGYASLKEGYQESAFYKEEGRKPIYIYDQGKLVEVKEKPSEQPVIVLPDSIEPIRDALDYYKGIDAIQTPLYKQLSNRLNQAEHHKDQGRDQQAVKHMEDFQRHLHNRGMQKFISQAAKEALDEAAQAMVDRQFD